MEEGAEGGGRDHGWMDGWMDGREPITVTRCIERKESCERLYSHSGLEVGGAQQVLKPNAQETNICICGWLTKFMEHIVLSLR